MSEYLDRKQVIDLYEKFQPSLAIHVYEFGEALRKLPVTQDNHGECKTCKHYVKGGLDGKTYVCDHPCIEREDYYDYACLEVEEKDFCSYYENYESKEGEKLENDRRGVPGIPEEK